MMPAQRGAADRYQVVRQTGFDLQHKRDTYLKKVDLHHHDFYELYFLVSGDVTYTIESKLYRIRPGDVLLISPTELHQLHIRAEQEVYERYVLWVDPRMVERLSTGKTNLFQCLDRAKPGYHNQLRLSPEEQRYIHDLIRRFDQEHHEDAYGTELMSESFLTQLLVTVNRIAARAGTGEEDSVSTSRIVSAAVDHIEAHYGEPLSLDTLAEQLYVSKYHLSHEFNRLVGTSVHRYILKKRLLTARQMMAQGGRPSKVWEPCGFGDYTGFYRAFRAEYGMAPKEYMASLRQDGPPYKPGCC